MNKKKQKRMGNGEKENLLSSFTPNPTRNTIKGRILRQRSTVIWFFFFLHENGLCCLQQSSLVQNTQKAKFEKLSSQTPFTSRLKNLATKIPREIGQESWPDGSKNGKIKKTSLFSFFRKKTDSSVRPREKRILFLNVFVHQLFCCLLKMKRKMELESCHFEKKRKKDTIKKMTFFFFFFFFFLYNIRVKGLTKGQLHRL